MKKHFVKPGFEFIFSFSLVMILGLPPVLLAQIKTQKDIEIKIENGDTTVNGKNIKDLSAADRESVLTDINNLNKNNNKHRIFTFKRRDTLGGDEMMPGKMKKMNREMALSYRRDGDKAPGRMEMRERQFDRPMRRFDRNSQNFEYVNIDKDGVNTHVSFRVSDVSNDDLKRMPYVEGPKFEIKDLNLVPQFSSGKILLMFNLLSKYPAEVKLSDSEGKFLWSEKAIGGTFSKSFALGLNGIYYLQVKQGKNISLKRIMKEE
jgi:hypothetical protein